MKIIEKERFRADAAAHDKWFRPQVGQAVQEADDPATIWLSNEEAKSHSAARRAQWLKSLQG